MLINQLGNVKKRFCKWLLHLKKLKRLKTLSIGGSWSSWSSWSTCSGDCVRIRRRECSGNNCQGSTLQHAACVDGLCTSGMSKKPISNAQISLVPFNTDLYFSSTNLNSQLVVVPIVRKFYDLSLNLSSQRHTNDRSILFQLFYELAIAGSPCEYLLPLSESFSLPPTRPSIFSFCTQGSIPTTRRYTWVLASQLLCWSLALRSCMYGASTKADLGTLLGEQVRLL